MDLFITRKMDVRRARKFADVFWFKDGHTTTNDGGKLERSYKEFHPPKLGKKILVFPRNTLLIWESKFNIKII